MSKKKDLSNSHKLDFSYDTLFEDLSDQAFRFCVDQLYPVFNYKVLQIEDIRRIDVKEQLLTLNSNIPKYENDEKWGPVNYYLYILKHYLNNYIDCKKGSRAEKYYKRVMKLIELMLSGDGYLEDLEDIVLIFIALFRRHRGQLDRIMEYYTSYLKFDVYSDDADLLKEIWKQKELSLKGIVQKPDIIEKIFGTTSEEKKAAKFAYIYNVVFLSRCLQNRGAFNMEEN